MRSFKTNSFLLKIVLLSVLTGCVLTGCRNDDFDEKAPPVQESRRVLVDVTVTAGEDKIIFSAIFYYDISEIVNGREVRGFGKNIITVKNARLGKIALKEEKDENGKAVYTAEIPAESREYELGFTPNDNLEAKHRIMIEPVTIKEKDLRVKKGTAREFDISRPATAAELPAIVEMRIENDNFVPVRAAVNETKLEFKQTSLNPFPVGKTEIRIKFKTNPGSRKKNLSIQEFNYLIVRNLEITE